MGCAGSVRPVQAAVSVPCATSGTNTAQNMSSSDTQRQMQRGEL
jgi:hypothetical protein